MEITPVAILAVLAGGVAMGSSMVTRWQIVGRGYVWLSAGTVSLFGAAVIAAGGGAAAFVAVMAALGAAFFSRDQSKASILFAISVVGFVFVSTVNGALLPALTGTVYLGGVLSEMLLGHWYLVDPQLPRWALQRLALAGGIGLVADTAWVVFAADSFMADSLLAYSFIALAAMTTLLILGVWFSLKEPNYTAVMAATGLSYLAVLTALGSSVVGRIIVTG